MKSIDVVLGKRYEVRIKPRLAVVRLLAAHPLGGWWGITEDTGRTIWIRTAKRLRRPVDDLTPEQTQDDNKENEMLAGCIPYDEKEWGKKKRNNLT